MHCRFCNSTLFQEFIDLVASPLSNSYITYEDLNKPEIYYPLKLYVCHNCYLVQIGEHKSAREIFNSHYAYFSSFSTSWLQHCEEYCKMIIERFDLNNSSLVTEIASNDGYLLQFFKNFDIPVLGIEPTSNTATVAIGKGIDTIIDFFGVRLAQKLSEDNKSDLIIGNNVLAHVPDINDFVGALPLLLKSEGIVTMEFPHLLQLIENNQFDTIYHEHFSYLSFYTVGKIFEKYGMNIFDVDEIPTHGGSLRIYGKLKSNSNKEITLNVKRLLTKELDYGINDLSYYHKFQKRIENVKNQLLYYLITQKKSSKKIAGYGAAAKGNTFINYCGIKSDLIPYVVDVSHYKQGKFLPGSHIPVVNLEYLIENKPDLVLILPWNIKDEIMNQLAFIKEWGGKFVISIPNLEIL